MFTTSKQKVLAVIQCTPKEVTSLFDLGNSVVPRLGKLSFIDQVLLVLPRINNSIELIEFEQHANRLGLNFFFGSEFDVSDRIKSAAEFYDCQIIVRVLLRQFYLDLEMVERQYSDLVNGDFDLASVDSNWNYALTGDVYTIHALKKAIVNIKSMSDQTFQAAMLFSPTVFMEQNPDSFKIVYSKTNTKYSREKSLAIRKKLKNVLGQNTVQFSSNYNGSSYAFIIKREKKLKSAKVLDVACGKGMGTVRLSDSALEVVGVDSSSEYIDEATNICKLKKNVKFHCKDANDMEYFEYFDCICSLHTLEHVSEPLIFIETLYNALKVGGSLYLEVPLLFPDPMNMPLNPYHLKEYRASEVAEILLKFNFQIVSCWGKDRHAFFPIETNDLFKQEGLGRRCTALLMQSKK